MKIINGDCLDEMKLLPDKPIDLVFADLPYGQTSCKWDCCIDLDLWWKEIMRIKKLNTPIFMTTTTKFGVSLINSAPKKLKFFDLVWVKSAPTGHLLAKKFPMRKHEMIYVFYEKLPFYDLSSHKHKFIKEDKVIRTDEGCNALYGKETGKVMIYDKDGKTRNAEPRYDPPLPVSVVKEPEEIPQNKYNHNEEQIYNAEYLEKKVDFKGRAGGSMYEPPLPTSMLEVKSTRGKHSTEKPVALMEWILKYYSKEGDVVLDSTMGSGSTGVACKNMNRDFIGIEMDKEIFKVAETRLK